MLALVANIGHFFGSPSLYVLVIIIGFLAVNEKIYGKALFLLLFTMIYNYYLKSLWQVPLPPPLEGWAFPSGHMHSAVVFWGWLAYQYRNFIFSALAALILCLVGYSLVYNGYHYPIDTLGALGFGSLSLIIYAYLNRSTLFTKFPFLNGVLFILVGCLLMFLLPSGTIKPHIWQAFGALIGFTLGWYLLQQQAPILYSYRQKIALILIAFVGLALIIYCLELFHFKPEVSTFIEFLAVAFWIGTLKITFNKILLCGKTA